MRCGYCNVVFLKLFEAVIVSMVGYGKEGSDQKTDSKKLELLSAGIFSKFLTLAVK